MIDRAFQHLPGIGPRRMGALQERGITCWNDILYHRERDILKMGSAAWNAVCREAERCQGALENHDYEVLARSLHTTDRWRLLAHRFTDASFFDIETSGLDWDSTITLIVCLHRDRLHTFFQGENLDDFLELLEDVRLLVSFNGTCFDVPRVTQYFHIPDLPCPHLDLRWPCYHQGLRGGLKAIEQQLHLQRPLDLQDVDGQDAVRLWEAWDLHGDREARRKLERYCAADVLALRKVASALLAQTTGSTARSPQPAVPSASATDTDSTSGPPSPPPVRTVRSAERRLRDLLRKRRVGRSAPSARHGEMP